MTPEMMDQVKAYLNTRASRVWRHFGPEWFGNIHDNFNLIKELGPHHTIDALPAKLPKHRQNMETIFVFASGASLTKYEKQLRSFKDYGLIFASPTQLQYLRYCGLEPDVLFSSDSNATSQSDPVIKSGGAGNMLLTGTPFISPNLVRLFPRKNIYMYNSVIQDEKGGIKESDYSLIMLWLLEKSLPRFFVQAGCVTNQMFMIATTFMNEGMLPSVKRIVFVGADHGFWKGYARCPAPELENRAGWTEAEMVPYQETNSTIEWEGMMSDRRMVLYKRSALIFYQALKPPVYDMSDGIFHEFPKVEFANIVDDVWPDQPTAEEINERVTSFMVDVFPSKFKDAFATQPADTPILQEGTDVSGKEE
jgi:hypothetical protein